MEVSALDSSLTSTWRPATASRAAEGFAAKLSAARESEALDAAQKLIATALVTPLLAELREQPLDAKLFHGGFGEDAFRQQLDTAIADEIVKSSRFPIVDRIYRDILGRAEARSPMKGAPLHG